MASQRLPRSLSQRSSPIRLLDQYAPGISSELHSFNTKPEAYFASLPSAERATLLHWKLPSLSAGVREQLSRHKEVEEGQELRRKAELDAVTPHFARIRGEAHLRWNEIHRLWENFREVVALVQAGKANAGFAFSYEEPRHKKRLHFTLWDRPSFVIAHAEKYNYITVDKAKRKVDTFLPERNHYFLEFTGAEHLTGMIRCLIRTGFSGSVISCAVDSLELSPKVVQQKR